MAYEALLHGAPESDIWAMLMASMMILALLC